MGLFHWLFDRTAPKAKATEPKNQIVCDIELHDFVIWFSQGAAQWLTPRRVVYLVFERDEWWAFCDGGMTGLRVVELKKTA